MVNRMESIWNKDISLKKHQTLAEDISINTAVIGGGLAGILIAYALTKGSIDTVIIEADKICSGQTKNTTAKITSQHGVIYSKIEKYYGKDAAKKYAFANEKAIRDYEKIIKENSIDCDFEKKAAILYSTTDKITLEHENTAAKNAGIKCYLTEETELPFAVKNALVFENQAQFNPLKFINGLTDKLKIYENTPAIKIKGNTIYTPKAKITAKRIVIACHYPFINYPEMYFLRLGRERSYVIAGECLKKELKAMYIGTQKSDLSVKSYNNYIFIGGGSHRTGVDNKNKAYKNLLQSGKKLFSQFHEAARWSAQDCITLDNIPYIGHFSKKNPDIFVATGFGKWGMTSSMVSANIISDLICKNENCYKDIFNPQRFSLFGCAKNMLTNAAYTIKGFASHILITFNTAENVPRDSAKIIKYNGKHAGAYRDKAGNIYIVSLECPHLKCRLNWNETTKTWDCPCHGSRYDYKGNLIDNPAQKSSILIASSEIKKDN